MRPIRIGAICGLAALAFVVSTRQAAAWSHPGHMVVAAIAWENMTPKSRAAAVSLLKLNPEWKFWVDKAKRSEQSEVGFIMAATWADRIKNEHDAYKDEDPAHPNDPPNLPSATQNIGYEDHFTHKYWHFIDTPYSPDGTPTKPTPTPNVVTQIEAFRTTLGDKSKSKDIRSYNLAWLEHLVGDVHQPLHAVTRFSKDLSGGDAGGNDVKLTKSGASELHAYWDEQLGSKMPTAPFAPFAEKAMADAKKITASPPDTLEAESIDDPKKWAKESFELAKRYAYEDPVGPGAGPYQLDASYKSDAKKEATLRVFLAEKRLANLINTALAP